MFVEELARQSIESAEDEVDCCPGYICVISQIRCADRAKPVLRGISLTTERLLFSRRLTWNFAPEEHAHSGRMTLFLPTVPADANLLARPLVES